MPATRASGLRIKNDSSIALLSHGTAQPKRPSRSTELNKRSRSDKPSRRMRAYCSSAFSNARLTLDGHSVVQALHARQLLSAASISPARNGSPLRPRNSSAARIALARPRVDMISSPVAINVGHMVGVCLRQPPQPLHCSRLRTNEPSLAANASLGSNGTFNAEPAPRRKFVSIQQRPSELLFPGLNRFCGSKDFLFC